MRMFSFTKTCSLLRSTKKETVMKHRSRKPAVIRTTLGEFIAAAYRRNSPTEAVEVIRAAVNHRFARFAKLPRVHIG